MQPSPRLYHGIMESMLDLMPAPHLIYNEWDKHGTCSGLSARAYFETIRKARAAIKIPPDYAQSQDPLNVAPDAVRDAFVKANSGLTPGGIAVDCDNRRLTISASAWPRICNSATARKWSSAPAGAIKS